MERAARWGKDMAYLTADVSIDCIHQRQVLRFEVQILTLGYFPTT